MNGAPEFDTWQARLLGGREQVHVLVEVRTDEGATGLGSAFTSGPLVSASLELLDPLLTGASALDPTAVSERLHQSTFWQGRGGAVSHAISAVDTALWDILGNVTAQPVSRLFGGRFRERIKPYGSMIMAEPPMMREKIARGFDGGFRAFKIGWRPFGRRDDRRLDEAIVAAARAAAGDEVEPMVDAGGSEEFWPHGLKLA